jgi:hypothetical protein
MNNYKQKYLKYKQKYLNLIYKNQNGGFNHIERLNKYNCIRRKLSYYKDINSHKYCIGAITSSTMATLITIVSINNFISSGSNGEVYNGTIEGINIAVKKQPLNEFQNTNIMITSTDGNIVN